MRKLIYSMMVSLDGFIARPNGDLDWILIDEELHTFANEQAREVDTELYGRRLWEVMVAYWPTADQNPAAPAYVVEFARIWRNLPKIVFSRTLDRVEGNARLAANDLAEEIGALKAQPGRDVSIGGAELAAQALRLGLVDEVRPMVQPVVLGAGRPMFPPSERSLDLDLVETRTFGSGVVYLRYVKRGA